MRCSRIHPVTASDECAVLQDTCPCNYNDNYYSNKRWVLFLSFLYDACWERSAVLGVGVEGCNAVHSIISRSMRVFRWRQDT